jgi:glycosyltransferase involved in cell wall biosynthesis
MIRVLQIVDHMGLGGMQAFIMNVYRNIDRTQVQFDFLLHKEQGNTYAQEIENMGGHMFFVPARNQGLFKNRKALDAFFKSHPEYRVVHQHESSLSYIEPLIAASNNGVPVRVIHSHSTRMGNNMIHKLLHYINAGRIDKIATHYVACGDLAGKWFYGHSRVKDNFKVVINGIKLKDFEFNAEVRKEMRESLDLGDSTVFCHIGRFDWVKNHTFLIDIFNEIVKILPNSKLVLVGNGVLMDEVKEKVNRLNLADKVIFLGLRSDINRIVQAVDSILLPSIYEGFPVTAIEAQAAGLPFVMSDTVSKEALIKNNSLALSLNVSPHDWAMKCCNNIERIPNNSIMFDKGFDINKTVTDLFIFINPYNERAIY